jgi:hypothetical protein
VFHALPGQVVLMAAPAQHLQPPSADLHVKHPYGYPVHGDAEVAQRGSGTSVTY